MKEMLLELMKENLPGNSYLTSTVMRASKVLKPLSKMAIQVLHRAKNASVKIDSFPGRLSFFGSFLLFFLCFIWW